MVDRQAGTKSEDSERAAHGETERPKPKEIGACNSRYLLTADCGGYADSPQVGNCNGTHLRVTDEMADAAKARFRDGLIKEELYPQDSDSNTEPQGRTYQILIQVTDDEAVNLARYRHAWNSLEAQCFPSINR